MISGGSYASSNDLRLHFGLGAAAKVDRVEVRWPSGAVERLTLPEVDRFYSVEEGRGIVAGVLDPKARPGSVQAPDSQPR